MRGIDQHHPYDLARVLVGVHEAPADLDESARGGGRLAKLVFAIASADHRATPRISASASTPKEIRPTAETLAAQPR